MNKFEIRNHCSSFSLTNSAILNTSYYFLTNIQKNVNESPCLVKQQGKIFEILFDLGKCFYSIGKCSLLRIGVVFPTFPSLLLFPPAAKIIPAEVMDSSELILSSIVRIREFAGEILPLKIKFNHGLAGELNFTTLLMGVFLEEVLMMGIQSLLLREIPRIILKIDKSRIPLVDCTAAKIARILLTSLAFSLLHTGQSVRPGFLVPQFVPECLDSYWREKGKSLAELTAIHFFYDVILCVATGKDI